MEAIDSLNEIKIANRRGEDLTNFKPEKKTEPATEPATKAMTFSVWSKEYPLQEGVKDKRSLAADLGMIRLHLDPFFGSDPLPNITRRRLVEYINVREKEKTIRNGKPSKKPVARGTISNELSLLRNMLNVYNREQVKKFVFHNYRNTALTDWADRGISADVAMQAAGHTSVQMHKRYLDLQRHHIANAFGLKSGDQKW